MANVPFSAFYETATGRLLSLGSVVDGTTIQEADAVLSARGITRMEVPIGDLRPDRRAVRPDRQWNTVAKAFDAITLPKRIRAREFWDRFTVTEREDLIEAQRSGAPSVQKRINAFVEYIRSDPAVDLNHPYIANSVLAMETAGIIGPGRAGEILS